MGERKLFRIVGGDVGEIAGTAARLERELQTLFETHLDSLLGIRFLATEFSTGDAHGGRIDTLGIDENDCPVIIEYKRHTNENIMSQVLFYLDWLVKNRSAFELLVLKRLGQNISDRINWAAIRLICIASDYAKYDLHAVNHIGPNIELITYRHYGADLLLLDYVSGLRTVTKNVLAGANIFVSDSSGATAPAESPAAPNPYETATMSYRLSRASAELCNLYEDVKSRLLSMGEDVQFAELQNYHAFKRIKNFACVEIFPGKSRVTMFLRIDPATVTLEAGFTRDVRNIGHYGTGDLEVIIAGSDDVDRAMPLVRKSYEQA